MAMVLTLFLAVDAEVMPLEADDPEYPSRPGLRDDGRNLIEEWLAADSERRVHVEGREFVDWVTSLDPVRANSWGSGAFS